MALAHANPRQAESPTIAYRRRARRLRCQLGNKPDELYAALAQLGRQQNKSPADSVASASRPVAAPNMPSRLTTVSLGRGDAQKFARAVEAELHGNVLTYSSRARLIRLGGRMGLDRFECNLLIAAVLHRLPAPPPVSVGAASSRSPLGWALLIALALEASMATLCYLSLA